MKAIIGLFVEDGSLAAAIVCLLAAVYLLRGMGEVPLALLLVGGTIAALLENVRRYARRR